MPASMLSSMMYSWLWIRVRLDVLVGAFDLDIGLQPLVVDLAIVGGEPASRGHAELRAIAQLARHLHRTLAEGALADQDAAAAVLDRAGHDLRGAGAAFVDQDHHRNGQRAPFAARFVDFLVAILEALDQDCALRHELAGDVDGGAQEAAGVAAQVEDQPARVGGEHVFQGDAHLLGGRRTELAKT